MSRMTRFERLEERRIGLNEAEAAGQVADSHEVRLKLMERVHSGEITLEHAQSELKRIKRSAKKNGLATRDQAYAGRRP